MVALYLTIWLAIASFVAGEWGRAADPRRSARTWPWRAFVSGLALAILHTVLSFAVVHGWSHEAASRSTAVQTAAVYGVPFGGGIYVNYAFLAVWAIDAWDWRAHAGRARPFWTTWVLRSFYMIVVFNAAVVFAVGWRRALGLVLTILLGAAWVRGFSRAPSSQRLR